MRLLASSCFLALALFAATGCTKINENFCDDACRDGAPDVPIDTPPIIGCNQDPNVCQEPASTCVADVCSDCDSAIDLDVQSAACTTAAAPICRADNSCGPCTDHEECTSGVCFNGTCAAGVLYVDDDGNDGGGNDCLDPADPCATITRALTFVPAIGGNPNGNRRFIRMQSPGTYAEPGQVTIDGKSVWIIAPVPAGSRAEIDRNGNGPVMSVEGGSDVRIEHLGINNASNATNHHGLICSTSTVVALGIEADDNDGAGIVSDGCTLTVAGSVITSNPAGGISVNGGRVVLVNNVIAANGSGASTYGGVALVANVSATSVVQSNTIVNNISSALNESDGINCNVTGLIARNNIIIGTGPKPRVTGACTHQNTLYTPADPNGALGLSNGNDLVLDAEAYRFVNVASLNYRLMIGTPASVAKDRGAMVAPEAMVDIDGEPRPQGLPDVGADEIP